MLNDYCCKIAIARYLVSALSFFVSTVLKIIESIGLSEFSSIAFICLKFVCI